MDTTTTLNIVLTETPSEENFPAQEQVTGTIPLRGERPAAEVLAECQARSPSPLFVP
jgi:hypothetical protein